MRPARQVGISPDNVGWNLWNMSKRISTVRNDASRAHQALDDPLVTAGLSTQDLARLTELSAQLDVLATEAQELWRDLQQAARTSDPTLVEPGEVAVIRNHGDDPRTMAAVRRVWGEGSSTIDAGWRAKEELDLLLGKDSGGTTDRGGSS